MKTILFGLRCLLSFSFATVFAVQVHAGTTYTITEIGDFYTEGFAINSSGQVTGKAITDQTGWRPFLYSGGTTALISTLYYYTDTGESPYRCSGLCGGNKGTGINASGQITGDFYVNGYLHAFLYKDGKVINLGTLSEGRSSLGYGINDNGQVTGESTINVLGQTHAFLYSDGNMIDLGTLGGAYSIGYGINNNGQVTGASRIAGDTVTRAFLYSDSKMIDIGTLGGRDSIGFAINACGQITGRSSIDGAEPNRAFLYSSGKMINLGTLGGGHSTYSSGADINARGQVVGYSGTHAFLYSEGEMSDLNDLLPAGSGWELQFATGINDAGQIVGTGYYNGQRRAFRMDPVVPPSGPDCSVADGIIVSTTSLSLTEGGATGTYSVALPTTPTADVVVTVSSDTQLNAGPAKLTFTPANWNTPQTVTVQALQDDIVEGDHTGIVTHTVTSADARYNGITSGSVTVAITDAVIPTVTVSVLPGTFWTQPDLPVTGTAAPGATVTLTVNNLSTGETRAVSAVADADGNWSLTLTGLTDGAYELQPEAGGITGGKVTVAVDSHAPVSSLSVSSSSGPTANGWYTGPVDLSLTATDGIGGSGVERSEHTLDGGAWTTFPSAGLTLSADGGHTVCYRSIDKAGNVEAERCAPIPIDATAPSVNPAFDIVNNLLHLNAQDSVSGIASIEISRDNGQTWTAQSGPVGFTRDGTYTVQHRVRDHAGNLATGQATVTVVTIPVITAPADQNALEAASQGFDLGAFSDQAADNPWIVDVDWGDGSVHDTFTLNAPGALGALPHAYLDNGSYTATIKVTDQAGNTGSKSFTITVANVAPTAVFTATSGSLNEGDVATLTFSSPADPSPVDTQAGFRYAFDCGDGAGYGAAGTTSTVTCAALDNPNQAVKGRVIDKDGGATEYSAVIAINNVAPTLGAVSGPTSPVVRDTPATITADFIDPGVRDMHTVTVDWDDGTVSAGTVTEANGSGSISASHSYAQPGRYIVTVTVTDKDGASATTTYSAIRVRGGPPAR